MEGKKNMGVKNLRPMKRSNNKHKIIRKKNRVFSINNISNIIPEIVDYLKSDSYFYSHFISSPAAAPSDYSSLKGEPILGNKDELKKKLAEYLKSDTYLYTPLEGTRHCDNVATNTVVSPPRGQEVQFTRVTSTVLSKKIAWQTKKVAENSVADKHGDHGSKGVPHDASVIFPETPRLQEAKKQAVRRSSRVSG